MHITNVSVNKARAEYQPGRSTEEARGSKWSFAALRAHLESEGVSWAGIWRQVHCCSCTGCDLQSVRFTGSCSLSGGWQEAT